MTGRVPAAAPDVGTELRDRDVERIATRVVAKIAKLGGILVLGFVSLWLFVILLTFAMQAEGSSGATTGLWLMRVLVVAVLALLALAYLRLLRRF